MEGTVYNKTMLILLGAPGVGKGTFGKRISKDFNMPIFSTGEYLRSMTGNKDDVSPLTERVRKIMSEGKLLDDETIIEIIQKRLKEDAPDAKGIIFDGFPRTIPQAEKLDTIGKIKAVINFMNKEEILIEKLAGRRECEKCHEAYNIANIRKDGYEMDPLLPKNDQTKCDKCGGNLMHRSDDQPTAIAERLKLYYEKTAPLEGFYSKKGLVKTFEPKKGVTDYPWVKDEVEKIINAP